MVSVLRDGSRAFTSNMESNDVSVLFPAEPDRPAVLLPAGRHCEGSVFDAEEERLFVMNRESAEITVLDPHALRVVETIPTPPGPVRVCRDPRGFLLVALYHGQGLLILDEQDYRRQRVVTLPDKAISVGYHAPSRTALLSTHAQSVCLVDVDAGRLLRTVATRSDPDPVRVVSLDI
jgi:YVTN family beta-propeller protein